MSLVDSLLHALGEFRTKIAGETNSGALVTIDQHIGELYAAAMASVEAGEAVAHKILHGLYAAFHGAPAAPVVPAPVAVPAPVVPPAEPTPTAPAEPTPAPAPVETTAPTPTTPQAPTTTAPEAAPPAQS